MEDWRPRRCVVDSIRTLGVVGRTVRDIARLRPAFTPVPEYLRGDSVGADINYMDYGVQLGRRFRALKAWMVWRTFGREELAARIREPHAPGTALCGVGERGRAVRAARARGHGGDLLVPRGPEELAETRCRDIVEKINLSGAPTLPKQSCTDAAPSGSASATSSPRRRTYVPSGG